MAMAFYMKKRKGKKERKILEAGLVVQLLRMHAAFSEVQNLFQIFLATTTGGYKLCNTSSGENLYFWPSWALIFRYTYADIPLKIIKTEIKKKPNLSVQQY